MNVDATSWHGGAVWTHRSDAVLAVAVWTERRPGYGEDAEPLFAHHLPTAQGVTGVFDGAAGAGASAAYEPGDGTVRNGAWVGSRTARAAVESWFRGHVEHGTAPDAESLRRRADEFLTSMRPSSRSKIIGTVRKDLPTTMAVAQYELRQGQAHCRALWAGDSRVYALTPRAGLQALTRDHTAETDALEQLRQDPPMTNLLSAGRPFEVDVNTLTVGLPCVLVTATDGFFGYVPAPAYFEWHLLDTLGQAHDEGNWGLLLARRVMGYTADDASLSVVALGFHDFAHLRESFSVRANDVHIKYVAAGPPPDHDPAAVRAWQTQTWHAYRELYEKRMPAYTEVRA
ncbi:hypothetical protein [Actinoallomurus soli]|uniref:hypothetical protein n=1 Tax=Actinoallomurus soli TaxID=2952535 RepID=UPI0020926FEF|nr:hypothetical protein [Actinoallomurus soli]MCO5968315.1 hypothetical protein [Actinoallomurus soli]